MSFKIDAELVLADLFKKVPLEEKIASLDNDNFIKRDFEKIGGNNFGNNRETYKDLSETELISLERMSKASVRNEIENRDNYKSYDFDEKRDFSKQEISTHTKDLRQLLKEDEKRKTNNTDLSQ